MGGEGSVCLESVGRVAMNGGGHRRLGGPRLVQGTECQDINFRITIL